MAALLPSRAPAQLGPRELTPHDIQQAADSNFVEKVSAPGAMWAVVNEPARMLAVGHSLGVPHQVSLFVLDDAGRVVTSTPPVTIKLPKPGLLARYTNVVAGLATHPTKPILYVLQDLHTPSEVAPVGDPARNPILKEFDRLFVYRLDPTNTQLVATWNAEWFLYGQVTGGWFKRTDLGVDAAAGRLYLGGLRDPAVTNTVNAGVGYIELDDQGLPVTQDGKPMLTAFQYGYNTGTPTGMGWVPLTSNVVVYGWYGGLATWDIANRRAPITMKFSGSDWGGMIAGHPTQPAVYRTTSHNGRIYAWELVDGFPTMFPQELALAYSYAPQVMLKRNQLAVGASGRVYLIDLAANGALTDKVTTVVVPEFAGTALWYAPGFDRLYAAAGKVP